MCLPAVIVRNVHFLTNKMDELPALNKDVMRHRECRLLCFTETWLYINVPGSVDVLLTGHISNNDGQ